jgi:hypothetical protein
MGEVEEQRVAAAGEQEARATDESGERSSQGGPQTAGHPRDTIVLPQRRHRLHFRPQAGAAASRGTGLSTIGQCTSAAKRPSPTEIHHIAS